MAGLLFSMNPCGMLRNPTIPQLNHLAPASGSSNPRGTIVVCVEKQEQDLKTTSRRRQADSTDWVASSLTRRFGLGAGLAWVGFLAFGVVSEQIKTRNEVALEQKSTRDVKEAQETALPNNIRYIDLTIGGGATPRPGDLVVVDLIGKIKSTGQVFIDTTSSKRKSLAFVFGAKPYSGGVCNGLENVLQSMKAGGKRKVVIPPELGFGAQGADFGEDGKVPPNSELEYIVQLQKVSIAPI